MYTGRHAGRDTERNVHSLGAQAHEVLKHRLLLGDFRLGARLGEVSLAAELGMSRTPVREALNRLHAEGLVVRLEDGGFSPAAPDLHTISELYEVRRSLEFAALNRGDHDEDRLRDLLDDWRSMEIPTTDDECSPEFVLHDEDFHVRLAAAAGNEALTDVLIGVNERIRMVRMHDFLTADRVRDTIDEHARVVHTLLDEGADAAGDVLSAHLAISESVVEQRAAMALSRMIGRHR